MSIVSFPKTSERKQTRSRSLNKGTRAAGQAAIDAPYKRKLIAFDAETWHALHLLARDTMKDIQELADEAFADVLRKRTQRSAGSSPLFSDCSCALWRSAPDLNSLHSAKAPTSLRRGRTRG
jgi:hypothetical protein